MIPIYAQLAILVVSILVAYYLGGESRSEELTHAKLKLRATAAVQHNLNCLVGDLRYEVKQLKPDADAYNVSKGLWCTDNKNIIKNHHRKELFFRLGYPEHKL